GAFGRAYLPLGRARTVSVESVSAPRRRTALLVHSQAGLDGDAGLAAGPPAPRAGSTAGGPAGLRHDVLDAAALAIPGVHRFSLRQLCPRARTTPIRN